MLRPTRVHFLDSLEERLELKRFQENPKNHFGIKVSNISCGTFHSLAVDINNDVWSWGGRGDICLGHNDSQLHGLWLEKSKTVFPTLTNSTKLMVPYELLDWCKQWSLPRLIKSLHFPNEVSQRESIIQLSAGDMHTSILYASGRMYFCGNGPVVSPIQMKIESDNEEDENETEVPISTVLEEIEKKMITVTTPRCPSARWFEKLSTRKIKFICSAGIFLPNARNLSQEHTVLLFKMKIWQFLP
jgi:alpha-tubulin suppressor-like RCC1 family protein